MGRDSFHFLNEASKVIPQMEVDNDYKERYAKILEDMIQRMLVKQHSLLMVGNFNRGDKKID